MEKFGYRIKQQREKNEMSLRDLAKKVGLSASFLSQVEKEKAYPSLQSLKRIADSLHTTIGDLIGETGNITNTPVLKSDGRKTLKHIGKGVELQFLSSLDKNHNLDPCIHKLEKDAISGDPPFQHFGQEFIYVLKGDMEFTLWKNGSSSNNNKYIMSEGDCTYFNSNIKHSFKNINKGVTEILCVSSPPYF